MTFLYEAIDVKLMFTKDFIFHKVYVSLHFKKKF